ncbi:putative RNA methyltransferase [Actinokineospora guangxiensis]|uniref:RNA methyltransferase n=1 Tax=Actinokineospora guangxiensis TaxID=1490288 RepID=A0ABW0ELD5_9PSEU
MLAHVLPLLACPNCANPLEQGDSVLRCAGGHSFDIAKQGVVTLVRGKPAAGDTAEMVAARAAFLDAGHYAPIADALASLAGPGPVLDAGAGTGHYLAHLLECVDGVGLALDSSKPALRKAAKAHPAIGAVACDLWQPLPVRTGVAGVVLNVFAPRVPAELRRVLREDGVLLLVAPAADHLGELVSTLDLMAVEEGKQDKVDARMAEHFTVAKRLPVAFPMRLDHDAVRALVGMGPNAFHGDRSARVAGLPARVSVTASVTVTAYRPR